MSKFTADYIRESKPTAPCESGINVRASKGATLNHISCETRLTGQRHALVTISTEVLGSSHSAKVLTSKRSTIVLDSRCAAIHLTSSHSTIVLSSRRPTKVLSSRCTIIVLCTTKVLGSADGSCRCNLSSSTLIVIARVTAFAEAVV
jgi:hypothetical protein